jgi:plastocyanin
MDKKRNDRRRRTNRRTHPAGLAIVAVTGGLLLIGCGDDDTTTATDSPSADETPTTSDAPAPDVPVTEIDVTAGGDTGEFGYTTDLATIDAGRVQVNLTNDGAFEHQAMFLRIDDATDFAGLLAAGAQGPDAFLDLVEGYGGPNGAAPGGGTATSTQDLEAGRYLLACLIPDASGTPHIAQGMFREFTVTEPTAPVEAAALADAGGEVTLVDFGFTGDSEFAAGSTVAVTNEGEQGHEIVAYPIEGDATIGDVAAALAESESGAPLADGGAGLGIVRPGGTASFRLPDRPGRYALVCFIPDVDGDLASHFTKGMLREVVVT